MAHTMSETFRPRGETRIETEPKRRWAVATLELMGPRSEQQDIGDEIETMIDGKPALAVAIADGHWEHGREAAAHAVTQLLPLAGEEVRMDASWIRERFEKAQKAVTAVPRDKQCDRTSGTTASLVLLQDDRLMIGYVGDSEARIWNQQYQLFTALTTPHRIDDSYEESKRLKASGAETGLGRLYHSRYGGIGITRALGDNEFEPHLLHTPDIVSRTLSPVDRFLVLASDGFWDWTRHKGPNESLKQIFSSKQNAEEAKKRLAQQLDKWLPHDNVLIKIIDLKPSA